MKRPSSLRGLPGAADIARLAYGYLGTGPALAYAPNIPWLTRAVTWPIWARRPFDGEAPLVTYDHTSSGLGTSGFVVTGERFCWKSEWALPRSFTWDRVPPDLAYTPDDRVLVDGAALPVRDWHAGSLARFLRDMASRAGRGATHYRSVQAGSAAGPADAIVLLAWEKLGAVNGVRYHPFITLSDREEVRALAGLDAGEELAVLYEDGMAFGSRGFALTTRPLAWFEPGGATRKVAWKDLGPVTAGPLSVSVGQHRLPWTILFDAREGLPEAMVALLRAVAESATKIVV